MMPFLRPVNSLFTSRCFTTRYGNIKPYTYKGEKEEIGQIVLKDALRKIEMNLEHPLSV